MRVLLIACTDLVYNIPDYQQGQTDVDNPPASYADELAEQAGRLCYLSWDRPNPRTATNRGYLDNILTQGHFSVLEHASATFYIDEVTRNFTHELIRHRHLSFSEVSQRYVDASNLEFVEHPGLANLGRAEQSYLAESVRMSMGAYDAAVDNLIEQGKPRKQARQAARHALPGGTGTKILVTGNMRAWREVLWKRLSPAADLEFQQVARLILAKLKKIAPNTFQDFTDPAETVTEIQPTHQEGELSK